MPRPGYWRREGSIPFNLLQGELMRLVEDYFQPEQRQGGGQAAPTDLEPKCWTPSVDVYESADETVVVADIPGVDPSQIELSVTGNLLVVRGLKEPSGYPEAGLHLRERQYGAFLRQISLASEVDFDAAHADAKNGVLTIRLPKKQAARPRNIPIRPN